MTSYQVHRLVNVPLAPELGLFLDKAFYDSYNKRWGEDREVLELDDYQEEIDKFKVRPGVTCRLNWNELQYLGCRVRVLHSWAPFAWVTAVTVLMDVLYIYKCCPVSGHAVVRGG